MSNFYVVSTPIGNLEDITVRALKTLNSVDYILCEDQRITKKLLNHYNIKTPTISYHQHSKLKKFNLIFDLLKKNNNLALVSDAGTPSISDPGSKLISEIIKEFGQEVNIIPIPGPSALTACLSICGLKVDKFLFLGFLPKKKKRSSFLQEIITSRYPVVFFESPYRILKTLKELENLFKTKKENNFEIVVCKELTKKFERVFRGDISKIIKEIEKTQKGEFVIVIERKDKVD